MQPLVSVLIPAFNAGEWVAETLRSAIAQTWPRKEIILIDDGSSDETLAIARRFESDEVRVIPQGNQGAAAARNKAFSLSAGDYIQWLDADDLLAPDKISKQMEVLGRHPSKRILLSSAFGRFMYRRSRAKFVPTALWCDLSPAEWLLRKMGENLFMQPATWLVSRELTEAAGPWDTRLLVDDDGEYFCRVLLASAEVRFVPDAKVYYRMSGPGSLSYIGPYSGKVDAHWLSMQMHIRYLQSLENTERVRTACVKYMQSSVFHFYPERPDIVEQMKQTARDMGGQLQVPRLSWKYSWIRAFLGYGAAKRARLHLPQHKQTLLRLWDKALFHLEN
jgi:glycosyltransferase involved in cell wall biosynthesis